MEHQTRGSGGFVIEISFPVLQEFAKTFFLAFVVMSFIFLYELYGMLNEYEHLPDDNDEYIEISDAEIVIGELIYEDEIQEDQLDEDSILYTDSSDSEYFGVDESLEGRYGDGS